jgi:integrase|tara:strand:+ start:137 stop:1360 length:1224 start_codon:yes stop_codon:yes gene_type:complete
MIKKYINQDKSRLRKNIKSWRLDLRSLGGGQYFFENFKDAKKELDKFLVLEKTKIEDSDNWTMKDLLGEFPNKDTMYEWDQRLKNNDPLRTFYWREYKNMKNGKPLPDYFDKYKYQFVSILSINVGGKTVGELKPRDVTVEHCETYILPTLFNSGKKGKRSFKTVKEMRSCFNKLMAFGKSRRCIAQNPMLDAEFKKPIFDEENPLEKLSTDFIHEIEQHLPKSISLAYKFACGTGLRAGEQRALMWEDINFDMSEVSVTKSAKLKVVVNGEVERNGLGAVKTTTSNRIVPIPANILRDLKELYIKQGRPTNTFVFGTKYNTMIGRTHWREQLQKVVKKISDKHMRWHDLRHYYASKMLEYFGNDVWTVSNLMGHSNIDITQRVYGHWMQDLAKKQKLQEKISNINF